MQVILCVILIFCLASKLLTVYKQNSRDHSLAKQLRFYHRVVKVQTRNKSAVRWVVLVTCVFLLCYGIFLRCSLLFLTGHKYGNDDCCSFTFFLQPCNRMHSTLDRGINCDILMDVHSLHLWNKLG